MTSDFGKYQLVRRLASGGMGEVYLARAPGARGFEKKVVLKRVLPHLAEEKEFLELFLDEARIAASLNHPNVAQIFDLGEVDGSWFLTMEYVPGRDLRRVLARVQERGARTLPLGLTLRIISDAAAGLDYAHKARDPDGRPLRIVHRDVSPHNVLVGFDGGVKLIDFGVAKAANRLQQTGTGLLRGKFPYMSPEQVEGVELDGRADVFSLGIVFWEVLTGTRLFRAASDAATVRLVAEARVEAPSRVNPDVPAEVDALCLRALARDPDRRYPDAGAMRLALEDCLFRQRLPGSAMHLEAFMRGQFADDEELSDEGPSASAAPAEASVATRALGPTRQGRVGSAGTAPPEPETQATVSVRTQALLLELVGRKTNLAVPQTRFIGRRAELDALSRRFDQGARLVTLTGPGGTGKTRLANGYAESRLGSMGHHGGAWWCDLTEAEDTEGILHAVGRALKVPLSPGRSTAELVQQLAAAIARMGEVLLVFDNLEQVVPHAAATVGEFLQQAEQARFLATSRERLGLPGEVLFEVPPLDEQDAVALFLDRAQKVRPGYAPGDEDRDAIREIVRQLDGLPLAIELAAARMGVLSPAQLAQRLPRRFELLKGQDPTKTPRQATLKGAIDWSWRLLQPWEQSALAQLAAFRGGFSLEAAEAVVSLEPWPQAPWVLDVVHTLQAKSLVRTTSPPSRPDEVRFGLLESIRAYAVEKLRDADGEAAAWARHADHYLPLGLALARAADGPDGLDALDRLQLERDNLLQAFQRAVEWKEVDPDWARRAVQAVVALAPLMLTRGPFSAQLAMFDAALHKAQGTRVDPLLLARAHSERGRARQMRGRFAESIDDFRRALELLGAQATDEARGEQGRLYHFIANAERLLGQKQKAEEGFRRALDVLRSVSDRHGEARALGGLASLEQELGAVEDASRHYQRALAILRDVGDRRFEGVVLGNLGALEQDRGRVEEARARYDEALAIHQQVGNRRSEGVVLANLGALHRDAGRPHEARAHYRRAVSIHREVGDRRFWAIGLCALAGLEHEAGALSDAQLKYEQALEVFREVGDRGFEGLGMALLAAVLADLKDGRTAARCLQAAHKRLDEAGDEALSGALEVLQAHVAMAAAEGVSPAEAEQLRQAARARLEAVHAPMADGGPSLAQSSAHVRDALRCLSRRHPEAPVP
jgi:predicted ATPase/serine/threonine protein kinase/Tfp pilus assembly protein PilF